MTIEETIDEVKIARAATARAHSNLACKVSLRTGSKSSHLFMPYMYPLDLFTFPDYVGQAIQRITNHSIDPLYTCIYQGFNENLCHFIRHVLLS
jgi:hypothetical protein